MYIMVKTISGILLNTIIYHDILRQYIYDGGRKGQKPIQLALGHDVVLQLRLSLEKNVELTLTTS